MIYELLDTDGFNLVGAYETEEEAFSDLRQLVAVNGFDYVRTLSLLQSDEDDNKSVIAIGFELAQRAQIPEPATIPR
ncbi:MAG: hypothetical protein QOF01_1358 [Thermomicrobiales bacterium]|jgi:hypothetical protein|nr:hypothetical protein [Thermomicrobiales bacterium]MEA2531637.1 hypothetical protein [Thermomicrobiales bacterium]MEA2594889.1 hypothetical protein [Thermomicrobiales bacterium]